MARWLTARGYPVSMLTWNEGHPDGEPIDGIRVYNICPQTSGLRGLRFFHPRWTGLVRAMSRADTDIYYQNCGECVTGQVAMWCRLRGRKFIYSIANDSDVDPSLPEMKFRRERLLYTYGLRHADHVISQTRFQQQRLLQFWNIESSVVPMPCSAWDNTSWISPVKTSPTPILWIGRIAPQKRFEWLIEIARLCPDLHFDVVGHANIDSNYSYSLETKAKSIENITLHGSVSHEKMYDYYRAASLLLCTSRFEGFPNTFLEAWSLGLPTVSTFDPDHLIGTHHLGKTAEDIPGLIAGIRELLNRDSAWNKASDNAKTYFRDHHAVDVVMPQFENIFLSEVSHYE
jgi:glycosyltransferase involved in cell wall biosynthesis